MADVIRLSTISRLGTWTALQQLRKQTETLLVFGRRATFRFSALDRRQRATGRDHRSPEEARSPALSAQSVRAALPVLSARSARKWRRSGGVGGHSGSGIGRDLVDFTTSTFSRFPSHTVHRRTTVTARRLP